MVAVDEPNPSARAVELPLEEIEVETANAAAPDPEIAHLQNHRGSAACGGWEDGLKPPVGVTVGITDEQHPARAGRQRHGHAHSRTCPTAPIRAIQYSI